LLGGCHISWFRGAFGRCLRPLRGTIGADGEACRCCTPASA